MTFQELVYARHSVRKFTGEPVPREIIDTMIAEAQSAPSSKNCKSSAFMIIDEPDTISAISQMRSSGSAFAKDAKAVIVVLGDEEKGRTCGLRMLPFQRLICIWQLPLTGSVPAGYRCAIAIGTTLRTPKAQKIICGSFSA